MAEIPLYPLYNTSYQLYRVSPLHHGDSPLLNDRTLRTHARRLRDLLKGDNVRGVDVDFAGTEGALPKLGPLEECNWDLVGDEDAWIDRHRQSVDPDASQLSSVLSPDRARGIGVELGYEKTAYNALLLRDPGTTPSPEGFTSLPLLMVKMPAAIREVFLNYLKTAFDAHVAPLRLPSTFLASTLETYFRHLGESTSTQKIQHVIQQLKVQLTFPQSTSLLKHIEVTIASHDVPGFISRGKLLATTNQKPFTAALSRYIQKHLAFDLSNPKVYISRIQCGAFVLQTDRLKLMLPEGLSDVSFDEDSSAVESSAAQLAVQEIYSSLIREATGTGKFLPESIVEELRSSTPSSVGSGRRGRRKRAVSTTASSSAATKRPRGRPKTVNGGLSAQEDEEMADA
ncbi:kinetochore complex Sim4 subunit Fta1-domain-containing protein [Clohesyomyces aquaticus]|uniref:Kinetochore complex Sim4 subunit Fta1-domain-containing protein n=1 Tax=Clohesyomyces aquaticus TaxID=1231657 RepID=A0A1Y1ZIP1_9PLEO|nr:kinetochore complex Sim4 subunit Fta1-domain-containing protein [Clohesyomyces aquaticus]